MKIKDLITTEDYTKEELLDIIEYRMNLRESVLETGYLEHIRDRRLAVFYYGCVLREKVGQSAVFKIEKLCESKLVANRFRDIRQIVAI